MEESFVRGLVVQDVEQNANDLDPPLLTWSDGSLTASRYLLQTL